MPNDSPKLVIEGITTEGTVFRPSDWVERLLDSLAHYGQDRRAGQHRPYRGPERRQGGQAFLQAQICDGHKCLIVDLRLRDPFKVILDWVFYGDNFYLWISDFLQKRIERRRFS